MSAPKRGSAERLVSDGAAEAVASLRARLGTDVIVIELEKLEREAALRCRGRLEVMSADDYRERAEILSDARERLVSVSGGRPHRARNTA